MEEIIGFHKILSRISGGKSGLRLETEIIV